jgi:DnaK suppressor protein
MKYFTIEQREGLERQLKTRAESLCHELEHALHADTAETEHLVNHFEEVDDEALADLEESLDIAAIDREMRELREVRDALKRVHTPDFGLCVDCGAEIPYSRLSVQPVAVRCTACQAADERKHADLIRNTL